MGGHQVTFKYAGTYGPNAFTDSSGLPLANLAVTIYEHGTQTLAALWTDKTKVGSVANPTTTDTFGNLTFFADPGAYDIVGNGETITEVLYADPAEPIVGDLAGTIPSLTLQSTAAVKTIIDNEIAVNGTVTGIEATANAALPKAGGTMTGDVNLGGHNVLDAGMLATTNARFLGFLSGFVLPGGITGQVGDFFIVPSEVCFYVCTFAGTPGTWVPTYGPQGAAGGDLAGFYPGPTLADTANVKTVIQENAVPVGTFLTVTSSGTVTLPAGTYNVICLGGGGGGGGAGSASSAITQTGGGGGGSCAPTAGIVVLAASTVCTMTVGAGGTGGAGGAAGGNTGSLGSDGGDSIFSCAGYTIQSRGGAIGAKSSANSTATVGGGCAGSEDSSTTTIQIPGNGGTSSSGYGYYAGGCLSYAWSGGGGGAPSSTTKGGAPGSSGTQAGSAAGGGTAVLSTAAGGSATAAGSHFGAGGGGGGGGATGGAGGAGAPGDPGCILLWRIA